MKGLCNIERRQNQGESRQVKASRDGDHPNSQHECRLCESPKGDVLGIQPHPDHHDWHARGGRLSSGPHNQQSVLQH